MNKTVKKLDNNVVKALTLACEFAKENISGFEWLTHTANYSNFPASLVITCVFDDNQALRQAQNEKRDVEIRKLIQNQLLKVGILLKDARRHICFDTEEACLKEHNGNWKLRL